MGTFSLQGATKCTQCNSTGENVLCAPQTSALTSISPISSISTDLGVPFAIIPFMITSLDVNALVIQATSSNNAIIEASEIILGGAGTARTCTLPPPAAIGEATITLTIEGSNSVNTSFQATINS
jgi:hypothetical protein